MFVLSICPFRNLCVCLPVLFSLYPVVCLNESRFSISVNGVIHIFLPCFLFICIFRNAAQMRKNSDKIGMYRIIILSYMYLESCSLPEKKDEIGVHILAISSFHLQAEPTFSSWMACLHVYAQGLVTIHVNILSMYKHVQERTSFLPPLASSRVCFLNSF